MYSFTHFQALLHSLEYYLHHSCRLASSRWSMDDSKFLLCQWKANSLLLRGIQGFIVELQKLCKRQEHLFGSQSHQEHLRESKYNTNKKRLFLDTDQILSKGSILIITKSNFKPPLRPGISQESFCFTANIFSLRKNNRRWMCFNSPLPLTVPPYRIHSY